MTVIIDRLSRSEPLTEEEQRFGEWASGEGFRVLFHKVYPKDAEPFLACDMCAEEMVNDKLVANCVYITDWSLREEWSWPGLAAITRLGLTRLIEENQ